MLALIFVLIVVAFADFCINGERVSAPPRAPARPLRKAPELARILLGIPQAPEEETLGDRYPGLLRVARVIDGAIAEMHPKRAE